MPDPTNEPIAPVVEPIAGVEPKPIVFDGSGRPTTQFDEETTTEPVTEPEATEEIAGDEPPAPPAEEVKTTYTAEEVEQIRTQERQTAAAEAERRLMERQLLGDTKAQLAQYVANDPYVQELKAAYLEAKENGDTEQIDALNAKYVKQEAVLKENFELKQAQTIRVNQEIGTTQATLDKFSQTMGIDPNEFYKNPAEMDARVDALLTRLEKKGALKWVTRGQYEYPHLTGDATAVEATWKELGYAANPKAPPRPGMPDPSKIHAPSPTSIAGSERTAELTTSQMEATWKTTIEAEMEFAKMTPNEQLKSYRGFKAWEKGLRDTGYVPPAIPQHIRTFEKRLPRN